MEGGEEGGREVREGGRKKEGGRKLEGGRSEWK